MTYGGSARKGKVMAPGQASRRVEREAFLPTSTRWQRKSRKLGGDRKNESPRDRPDSVHLDMSTLFHHPFCPHSRFVRLALNEYGVATRLIEERTWERRRDFLAINPAGTTPVLVDEGLPPVPGAGIIAEYLDELCGDTFERRLLPRQAGQRVEVRRLMSWFNDKFFAEVSGPLTAERLYKRHMPLNAGGGHA